MKYTVSMKVYGRIDVEVDAATPAEAFEKATIAFMNVEMKDVECVDSEPVNCTDSSGNITDY